MYFDAEPISRYAGLLSLNRLTASHWLEKLASFSPYAIMLKAVPADERSAVTPAYRHAMGNFAERCRRTMPPPASGYASRFAITAMAVGCRRPV